MFTETLVDTFIHVKKILFYSRFVKTFYVESMIDFIQVLFLLLLRLHVHFLFFPVLVDHSSRFSNIKLLSCSWDKPGHDNLFS